MPTISDEIKYFRPSIPLIYVFKFKSITRMYAILLIIKYRTYFSNMLFPAKHNRILNSLTESFTVFLYPTTCILWRKTLALRSPKND